MTRFKLSAVFVVAAAAISPAAAGDGGALNVEARNALSNTLRGIIAECLPEKVEVKDDWGDTRGRFSQLKVHRDGFKLDFEVRKKEVKHGLWKQATIVPVEPEKNLQFRIVEARSTSPRAFAFQLLVSSPLKVVARVERWRSGVKMLNFSGEADAQVEMRLNGTLEYDFTTKNEQDYLAIIPKASAVDLKLVDLEVRRVGLADGPVVNEVGELLTGPLGSQLDKQESKVVEKLNAALVKKQDKLRVAIKWPFDFGAWALPSTSSTPAK